MGRKAWWGRAYGVAKSWTQLNMHPNTHVQLKKKKCAPNENVFMQNVPNIHSNNIQNIPN